MILEAQGLFKSYLHNWTRREIPVIRGLDLALREREIFGLIGPNGAGKTTTFKLLLGLLHPTRGTIRFQGRPIDEESRRSIGFLPEQPYFYDHLTVSEILDFYGRLVGLSAAERRTRIHRLLEQLHLADRHNATLRTLSKGTVQRVGIAQAILSSPQLLILDEPMSGLDPVGRRFMRELIRTLRSEGTTVIFSSHILPDAEVLCDRVGILAGGRIPEIVELRHDANAQMYAAIFRDADPTAFASGPSREPPRQIQDGLFELRVKGREELQEILDRIRAHRGQIERVEPVYPSLEERFLAYSSHEPLD